MHPPPRMQPRLMHTPGIQPRWMHPFPWMYIPGCTPWMHRLDAPLLMHPLDNQWMSTPRSTPWIQPHGMPPPPRPIALCDGCTLMPIALWDGCIPYPVCTSSVNRMTDRCKNITFLQLRLRAVKMKTKWNPPLTLSHLSSLYQGTCNSVWWRKVTMTSHEANTKTGI